LEEGGVPILGGQAAEKRRRLQPAATCSGVCPGARSLSGAQ
jgi:hypothetical protein